MVNGQKLRKLTCIMYLNPNLGTDNSGDLRLYLKENIVDVSPILGRMIIFMSECVEHEVRPTIGY